MRPRRGYLLRSTNGQWNSITLTWIKRDLLAGGRTYQFFWGPSIRGYDGKIKTRQTLAVIDAWPAEDH